MQSSPDYGPFGTAPAVPGVVYFGEKWTARKGSTLVMIGGIVMTCLGVLMLLGHAVRAGLPFAVVGLIIWLVGLKGRKSDVHMDVICDAQGLTMRRNSRDKGNFPTVRIPWAGVTATRCIVTVLQDRSSETGAVRTTYIQEFAVDVAGSPALQMSTRSFAHLDAFIGLCNQSTPHLGYRWIPRKTAQGLPIIEESLKFSKVPSGVS
jgi:hypothetical protein